MVKKFGQFLTVSSGVQPPSLHESIRGLTNLSAGFCLSWARGDYNSAKDTSDEAFVVLNDICTTLLGVRDDKKKSSTWIGSQFKTSMEKNLGYSIEPSVADVALYEKILPGFGAMPPGTQSPITLERSLNKIKHRANGSEKFSVSNTTDHFLYVLTLASMQNPTTVAAIDMQLFCQMCKEAADAI